MTNVWFTSDIHFGHKNIIKYCEARSHFDSVEEMNEYLVDAWNDTVRTKDIVWVLGDFAFGGKYIDTLTPKLNGDKRLIMGNHDGYGAQRFLNAGFTKVYGAHEKYKCIMTHVPVHTSQFPRFRANIHGHTHENVVMDENSNPDPRYICVCVEQHPELKPFELSEIRSIMVDRGI